MRIVYLHQYFITPQMAGGSRSYEMARRLVAAGHEVHMVTSDQTGEDGGTRWRASVEAGINVHWTPVGYDNEMAYRQRIGAFLRFAWRAARKARDLEPDIIFATSTPLTIAIPAVYAARRCRVPMVFEVRDLWPAVPIAIGAIRNPLVIHAAKALEGFAYRNAARVVALAPGMRDEVVASGYPPERVVVIPNGCDLDIFAAAESEDGLRDRYAWLGERPLLVFTGTFGLVNGMDYLVRLAAELDRIDPEIRIAAIGAGRELESTRMLAAELGVLDRNLFLLGKKPKNETAMWTRTADMTIALFTGPEIVWRDAVQNKFFDSLAAGTPVANNFPGWQARIAEEAGAGIILSSDDIKAAAMDVAHSLRNTAWLEGAARVARQLAIERFNRDDLAASLAKLLEEVQREAQAHARLPGR
jgi:glycosyltransferase involved in cell wall biosynthesis